MLILTSAGFKNLKLKRELLKILPKKPEELKLVHVVTATKPVKNIDYFLHDREILKSLGFITDEIDIAGKNYKQLKKLLSDKDVIYVQGGNPYYLLKHVRQSGFDKLVKEKIKTGAIYVGLSAGSYLACPTIEMAAWKHQRRKHFRVKNLEAMNLVPFLISVHYDPKYARDIKAGISKSRYPVKILTDDQALLVEGGKVRLIGEGREVVV